MTRKAFRSAYRSSAAASTISGCSAWRKRSRACAGHNGRGRVRRSKARRSRRLLSPRQRVADQRQPVVAEIHIRLVEKDRRRTEAAARHDLVGVGLERILDLLIADAGKERFGIDAGALADFGQDGVLRDVLVFAPIDLEHGAGK